MRISLKQAVLLQALHQTLELLPGHDLAFPTAVPGVVGELHREDRVHVEAVELEGKHRTLITDIPGHHVRLYGKSTPGARRDVHL